jgi:mono/diheme cytochrome c family protein
MRSWNGKAFVLRIVGVLSAMLAVVVLGERASFAQERARESAESTDPKSSDGRESFKSYCAPCHGSNGRGHGPVAPALKTAPPDLTALTLRNGGTFPRDRVRTFVTGTGRTLPSHGPTEMPVWGPTFRAFESDAHTRERITSLVTHIESMQRGTP